MRLSHLISLVWLARCNDFFFFVCREASVDSGGRSQRKRGHLSFWIKFQLWTLNLRFTLDRPRLLIQDWIREDSLSSWRLLSEREGEVMAPKKSKEEPKERPILGRFKSHLKVSPTIYIAILELHYPVELLFSRRSISTQIAMPGWLKTPLWLQYQCELVGSHDMEWLSNHELCFTVFSLW